MDGYAYVEAEQRFYDGEFRLADAALMSREGPGWPDDTRPAGMLCNPRQPAPWRTPGGWAAALSYFAGRDERCAWCGYRLSDVGDAGTGLCDECDLQQQEDYAALFDSLGTED